MKNANKPESQKIEMLNVLETLEYYQNINELTENECFQIKDYIEQQCSNNFNESLIENSFIEENFSEDEYELIKFSKLLERDYPTVTHINYTIM